MNVGARVLRDGVVILTIVSIVKNVVENSTVYSASLCYVDSSTETKSTTYSIELKENNSCNATATNRALVIHYAFR